MRREAARAGVLVGIILGLVSFAGAEEPEGHYVVDAKFLAIRADDPDQIRFEGDHVEAHPSQDSKRVESLFVGGLNEVQIGPWTLTFAADGSLLWNGKPATPPADSGIELLAEPRLRLIGGKKAVIITRSQLQYFEAAGDGLFELHTSDPDNAPGLELGCTVTPDQDDLVAIDIELKLTLMERREEIAGVKLDVGRPILLTSEASSRLVTGKDRWALASIQQIESDSEDGGQFLLCLLRVRD